MEKEVLTSTSFSSDNLHLFSLCWPNCYSDHWILDIISGIFHTPKRGGGSEQVLGLCPGFLGGEKHDHSFILRAQNNTYKAGYMYLYIIKTAPNYESLLKTF